MLDCGLTVNKVHGEAIDGVVKCDSFTSTWAVEIVDRSGLGKRLRCILEVLRRLDDEGRAAELVLVTLDGAVYEGFYAVAFVEDTVAALVHDCESEVQQELVGFVEVLVGIVDVRDALQDDLLSLRHDGV